MKKLPLRIALPGMVFAAAYLLCSFCVPFFALELTREVGAAYYVVQSVTCGFWKKTLVCLPAAGLAAFLTRRVQKCV